MQTFIWTILVLIGIEAMAKIICLAIGYLPPRNKGAIVVDVFIGVSILIWGAIVLHGA